MRTNIVIDEKLIGRAKQLTGLKTKRAAVEEALCTLIQVQEQAQVRQLCGKLKWEGDLDAMREGRFNAVS